MNEQIISEVQILKDAADLSDIFGLIKKCLPSQGAIEVQNDSPLKEHAWHQHDTDETLIILSGSVNFYWEDNEMICNPGDVIKLPKGTRHGSVAQEQGAQYIITFEQVHIT